MNNDIQNQHSNVHNWTRQYQSLIQKEKLYHLTVQDVPSLPTECKKLNDLNETLLAERKGLQTHLAQERQHVGSLVDDLQAKLCTSQPGPSLVDELACLVGDIESALSSLQDKHKTQYATLVHEELQLAHDLELFLEDLERESAMEQSSHAPHTAASSSGKQKHHPHKATGLLPEVTECDDFVAQHGPSGGWDDDVHAEFLKVLKACGGDYGHAVLVCCEMMIGFTRQDIIEHARWHQQYAEHQLRKRVAIAAWRAKRRDEEQAQEAVRTLQQQQQQQQAGSKGGEGDEEVWRQQAARALQKQQLEQWREQKRRQQKEEAASRESAARSDLQRRDQERELRQRENKKKLGEYRARKAQQQRAAMAAAAAAAPKSGPFRFSGDGSSSGGSGRGRGEGVVSPERRERVASRNVELLRRLQALRGREREERDRREAVQDRIRQQVHVSAPRDPERLLQPTTAFKARLEADEDEPKGLQRKGTSGFVLHIPHLQTPAWLRPPA